jgi:hypothetical protein
MTAIVTAIPQFYPEQQATIAVTAASASVLLGGTGDVVIAYNDGANMVFIAFGTSTVTVASGGAATLTNDGGMWCPPGALMEFRLDPSLNAATGGPVFVAAICAATFSSTLRLSRGSGV